MAVGHDMPGDDALHTPRGQRTEEEQQHGLLQKSSFQPRVCCVSTMAAINASADSVSSHLSSYDHEDPSDALAHVRKVCNAQ